MIIELLILFIILYIIQKHLRDSRYNHIPGPSPWLSLPLIGHGYLLGNNPTEALGEMQKKYGDLFRLDIGGDCPTIWLCRYDQMREAFYKESFNGRYWHKISAINAAADKDSRGKKLTIMNLHVC